MRKRLVALLVPGVLLVAACGGASGTDTPDGSSSPSVSTSADPAASTGSPATQGTLEGVTVSGKPGAEPTVEIAEPPYAVDQTTVQVIEKGTADVPVEEGSRVQGQYVVVNGRTGKTVESSWTGGNTPTFDVSEGKLIPGLYKGLLGQQKGSRVAIAATAADAFGDAGLPDAGVEGGDTIVFVIDIQKITTVLPMAQGTDKEAPAGVPTLETDADGVPTGFTADANTAPAPKDLVVAPVIVGDGPELKNGQTVTVQYLGQLYPDGAIFDQSWTAGAPFDFQLGTGGVIGGWDQGLVGQRVGSRVVLVIPPDLAYGEAGSPPSIPGNSTLIFSVDILAAG